MRVCLKYEFIAGNDEISERRLKHKLSDAYMLK